MNSNNLLTNQESINLNTERDNSDISIKNKRYNILEFSSPLITYYNSSNEYLNRKLSENSDILNLRKSNNFIRKDSLYQNERQTSYNSYEENKSSEENNSNLENINNYRINNDINDIDHEEYNQLKSNGNYYQTYQDTIINSNNQIVYNNNTNSKNIIQLNQNQENQMNLQQNQIMYFNIMNQFNLINNNLNHRPRFNSTNISNGNNFISPIFSNNINSINNNNIEMFGKKGWICPFCNNFNYENRTKCNRCKIVKYNKNHNKKRNIEKETINNQKKNNLLKQKQFSERLGDWICFKCQNLNFAFRIFCNRCQLSKEESYQYFNGFNEKNKNIENMINNNNTTNLFINQKAIVVDVINKENNNNI